MIAANWLNRMNPRERRLAFAVAGILFLLVNLFIWNALLGMSADARAVAQLIFSILNGLAVVICFAAAVFYAGAISPALVVRKTLVFGATALLLLFLFFAPRDLEVPLRLPVARLHPPHLGVIADGGIERVRCERAGHRCRGT